jgi:hypothetical protein
MVRFSKKKIYVIFLNCDYDFYPRVYAVYRRVYILLCCSWQSAFSQLVRQWVHLLVLRLVETPVFTIFVRF